MISLVWKKVSNMGVILGVDPGSSGFVVALDSESRVFLDSFQLPFFSDGQLDVQSVYTWLKYCRKLGETCVSAKSENRQPFL